jgi:hypothetical protein
MDRRFQGRRWPSALGARGCAVLLACFGVALALGVTALHAASAPAFAPARNYTTGSNPLSVAIGDLNGDRKPDLATANFNEVVGSISVLLNRGDGSFRTKFDYALGRTSHSLAVGDLNGDGDPDLAITDSARTVSVLFNGGDGSFAAQRNYPIRFQPTTIALGDLNGDRRTDLVTANGGRSTVSVLLNKGDEGFEPEVDYRTGSGPSVEIGDLNGDRRPDLVTANLDANNVSVLLNRGDGSFKVRHDYRTGRIPSVEIGDLNGDRRPDLVTANVGAATVSVLLNKGNGSFRARRDYRTGRRSAEPAPVMVAIGDLNGDGKPDLATANYGDANTVSVLLNKGNGIFRARREYRTGRLPISVAIGDLNGDGKPDLATANQGSGDVSVLTNRGDGSFRAKVDFASGRGPASGAIEDLNGDGKPDLTTVDRDASTLSVLLNRPGLCTVQDVLRQTLPAARRAIVRANCRVGKIRRAYSRATTGRVISQKPGFGAVLPGGGKVNLVVSRGRRP